MKFISIRNCHFAALAACACLSFQACTDDERLPENTGDIEYIGQDVGNFSADEWYPGGKLGTTENVGAGCYEDDAPIVDEMGLLSEFHLGEVLFERNFNTSTPPFNGLGPASVRKSCIDCHPGYGHGKRQESYKAGFGNGYLLVIYHPEDGANSNDGPYISEVTGMPQTQAVSPFLPPVDEDKISMTWKTVEGTMPSGLSATEFPDGEKYQLIYPEVTISQDAFNTDPKPTNIAVRLESTIGIMGTGLIDAIPEDSLKKQYQEEAKYIELNPSMWDKAANDWASTAYYTNWTSPGALADGTIEQYYDSQQQVFVDSGRIPEKVPVSDYVLFDVMQKAAENGEESGTVLQVFQKGYKLGDKVIRHATVIVAE